MATTVKVVQRSVLRRAWLDVEPKLIAGLIAALSSAQVVTLMVGLAAGSRYVWLAEGSALIPTLAFVVVGYLKASTHKGALAAVGASLPGDLLALGQEALAAGILPQAAARGVADAIEIAEAAGLEPAADHGSAISDVLPEPTPIHQQ